MESIEEEGEAPSAKADSSIFSEPLFLAALGLVAFIAAASGASALAGFSAIAVALLAATRVWAELSLSRLEVSLSCGQTRLFPGERLTLRMDAWNRKILPVWVRVEIARSGSLIPEGLESAPGETSLLPFERADGSWTFLAAKRGLYSLGPATLFSGDTLGFHSREKALPFARRIVVFPRPARIKEFDVAFRDNFGIHPSKGIIEDPAWYEGTREYQLSRPARNIHWKASARLAVPQEKIFAPTSHQKVFLVLDGGGFAQAQDEGGLESALEVLAALAIRLSERGASFALTTDLRVRESSAVIPLGRGPEHLGNALELLARCKLERAADLAPLVSRAGDVGSGYLIVSRSPAPERAKSFFAFPSAKRNRVFLLFAERPQTDVSLECPALFFDEILLKEEDG